MTPRVHAWPRKALNLINRSPAVSGILIFLARCPPPGPQGPNHRPIINLNQLQTSFRNQIRRQPPFLPLLFNPKHHPSPSPPNPPTPLTPPLLSSSQNVHFIPPFTPQNANMPGLLSQKSFQDTPSPFGM